LKLTFIYIDSHPDERNTLYNEVPAYYHSSSNYNNSGEIMSVQVTDISMKHNCFRSQYRMKIQN